MKRKIIKQGHNTHTITLPSTWVRFHKLKPGQEIDLTEQKNTLILAIEPSQAIKSATFDITNASISTIWKYYMAVYRQGYDEVKIIHKAGQMIQNPYRYYKRQIYDPRFKKYNIPKTIGEALRLFTNRFIGFEIVEYGKDSTLIRSMSDVSTKEFDSSLRRVLLLIQSMAQDTLDAVKFNDKERVISIHDTDINLDKFHDYCVRVINKYPVVPLHLSAPIISTLQFVELIGDEYKNIANHLIFDFPKNEYKSITYIAQAISDFINSYVDLYYKFDKSKVLNLAVLDQTIYTSIQELVKKALFPEQEVFHHFRIIRRYLNSLVELRIQMEF